MFTEGFFNIILNLGNSWKVTDVQTDIERKEVDVFLEYKGKTAESPTTDEQVIIYDHREQRRWRHLDTMQYKTYLNASVPRVKDTDGKIRTIAVPWADSHERFTYLFECLAIDLLQATRNQTKTAKLLDCKFNVVNRILHRATERGMQRRGLEQEQLKHLSIDEKSFKKGHKYVSILSDPHTGRVLEVAEGRNKDACGHLLDSTLTLEQKQNIKQVSMDMWKAYINTVKEELPDAHIVHDRFHLIKYLNDAVDKVRRSEVKKQEELKGTKYLWLKNPDNFTEKQQEKFDQINTANFLAAKAWKVKENFRTLFACPNYDQAFDLFVRWAKDAIDTELKQIEKVVRMFCNHGSGVLYALISNLSNAMAERLNGKIQEIKTAARGYRRFQNFRSAILFFHRKLSLFPQNSQ